VTRGALLAGCLAAAATLLSAVCPARADDAQACIDASDRGQLLRIDKHLREAREQFVRCAEQECPAIVRESCVRWLDETGRAIPAIAFAVHDAAGNDVSLVTIAVDGVVVSERYDGSALALDPGEHAFRFSSGAGASVERSFRLTQGDHERREPIVLEPEARRETPGPVEQQHVPGAPSAPGSPGGGARSWGLVVGAAGVAGLLAGGVFGTLAIAQNDAAHCNAQNACGDAPSRRDAQRSATASTVAFAAGAALAAGGIVLVLVGGHPADGRAAARVGVSAAVTDGSVGLALTGGW
jgi:hypothetical protein